MTNSGGAPGEQGDWPRPALGWYAVGVLLVAYVFSFIDRTIIGLLVGPIKASLDISDTQFGVLGGIAFTLFYCILGVPIGRIADRVSRRGLIAAGVAVWSFMTALCGWAAGFWHLFLARVGVGVGEAALTPAAYSMIADYFPKERLGRALAVYQSGAFLGAALAFILGGVVIAAVTAFVADNPDFSIPLLPDVQGWRLVFIAVGAPGLLVALWMFTVREPSRKGRVAEVGPALPFRAVIDYVWRHRRLYLPHFIGFGVLVVTFQNVVVWGPAYFTRHFGLTTAQTGLTLGLVMLVFSSAGVIGGGFLSDRLVKRGQAEGPMRVGMIAGLALLPFAATATVVDSLALSLMLFCPMMFFASFPLGSAAQALQMVTPNEMRGQVSAIYMLFLNLLSYGLGPLIVGMVTDFVFADEGAVGYSLAVVSAVSAPVAAFVATRGFAPFRQAAEELSSRRGETA